MSLGRLFKGHNILLRIPKFNEARVSKSLINFTMRVIGKEFGLYLKWLQKMVLPHLQFKVISWQIVRKARRHSVLYVRNSSFLFNHVRDINFFNIFITYFILLKCLKSFCSRVKIVCLIKINSNRMSLQRVLIRNFLLLFHIPQL